MMVWMECRRRTMYIIIAMKPAIKALVAPSQYLGTESHIGSQPA